MDREKALQIVEKFKKELPVVGAAIIPNNLPTFERYIKSLVEEGYLLEKFVDEAKSKPHLIILIKDFEKPNEIKKKTAEVLYEVAKERPPFWVLPLLVKENFFNLLSRTGFLEIMPYIDVLFDEIYLQAAKFGGLYLYALARRLGDGLVAFVLAGSAARGEYKENSDIDFFVIYDDTIIHKPVRHELLLLVEPFRITAGIERRVNIQVYSLSSFWDSLRQTNPVIITFLRDGVPLYDRREFTIWKTLLKEGHIVPTKEAAEQQLVLAKAKLEEMKKKMVDFVIEDSFWASIAAAQSLLLAIGVITVTPKETIGELRKLGYNELADIIEQIYNRRKEIEHSDQEVKIDGKEIEEKYLLAKKVVENAEKEMPKLEIVGMKREVEALKTEIEALLIEIEKTVPKLFNELIEKGHISKEQLELLKKPLPNSLSELEKIKNSLWDLYRKLSVIREIRDTQYLFHGILVRYKGKEYILLKADKYYLYDSNEDKVYVVTDEGLKEGNRDELDEKLEEITEERVPIPIEDLIKIKQILGDVEILISTPY